MREFFHGWRRKAGCVTLVMALTLTGIWVRSSIIIDEVLVTWPGNRHNYLVSLPGRILLDFWDLEYAPETYWIQHPCSLSVINDRLNWFEENHATFDIPYWIITIPLTLLSAYLILWKPRKRAAKPESHPTI